MASFKARFPVLQELFAKNHRGPFAPPPSGARVKRSQTELEASLREWKLPVFYCGKAGRLVVDQEHMKVPTGGSRGH